MNRVFVLFSICLIALSSEAQILDITPAFPTVDDTLTIVYKAEEGNAALVGITPIYAHAGLITDQSNGPTDWQHVQGNWGTADANVLMTDLGNNEHQIVVDLDQYYGVSPPEVVQELAFVFRNADGSIVGRSSDGADIYYPVYPTNAGFLAKFFTPDGLELVDDGAQLHVVAKSNASAQLDVYDNGNLVASQSNAILLDANITASGSGLHELVLIADDGNSIVYDTINYLVNPTVNIQNPPVGTLNGLNYIDDNNILLRLVAPGKGHVYVMGDFNNWTPDVNYHMNLSLDGNTWWIQVSGLLPDSLYGYQYYIDGEIRVADPLSMVIADPNNDQYIDAITYPDPYDYPSSSTSGFVTTFKTNPTAFNWQHDAVTMPPKEKLMIYELLVRDFVAKHNYLTIIDSLDYIENLGVNAIELMPVGEFENNESWGYNPSFHMALDKYYGTPEHFKQFIDACHERGIAVIMDIALNHTFGQNPMVNMYWDAQNAQPASDNPWFNTTCPHEPFCWGYDMDHESQFTKDYIDRINRFWLDEYHIDGFRFDFTRGFLNGDNGYSNTRIDLLKRMADTLWLSNQDAYVILEHWADNNEESELSDYGMLLWGNITYDYHQAMKGYSSNFNWGMHSERGWLNPHLLTYIESHDEQRGMFECYEWGDMSNSAHPIQETPTALERAAAAAVIMLVTPGPKMIWQFGEVGYDIDIDFPCRVCNKPILWNYFMEGARQNLYRVYQSVLDLRLNYPTFSSSNYQYWLTSTFKKFTYEDPSMDAVVFSHFGVDNANAFAGFPSTGWWYEFFSGDSINVSNVNMSLEFGPGDYRIYTNVRIQGPTFIDATGIDEFITDAIKVQVYPNPSSDIIHARLDGGLFIEAYAVINAAGNRVLEHFDTSQELNLDISELSSGQYRLILESGNELYRATFMKD